MAAEKEAVFRSMSRDSPTPKQGSPRLAAVPVVPLESGPAPDGTSMPIRCSWHGKCPSVFVNRQMSPAWAAGMQGMKLLVFFVVGPCVVSTWVVAPVSADFVLDEGEHVKLSADLRLRLESD